LGRTKRVLKQKLALPESDTFTKLKIRAVAECFEKMARKHYGSDFVKYLPNKLERMTEHKNWKYFKNAYDIIQQEGANPKDYFQAQVDEMSDWGKVPFPAPNHLGNENARLRYLTWVQKNGKGNSDMTNKNATMIEVEVVESIADKLIKATMEQSNCTELEARELLYEQNLI